MGENRDLDNSKSAKVFSLTFIQVICAISVVTLHTNGVFWNFSATDRYWFTANIIESVLYFGVPIFFMVTGITLLDYRERYSTSEFFKKRAEKTVLPYVVWSLIGVVFLVATKRRALEEVTFKWVLNGLLSTSGIINLYWFFQPLFCVYLCIPVFSAITKDYKKKVAEYVLIVCFFVNILFPFINAVFNLEIQWTYQIAVASGYLFWIWAGYYFYNYPPKKWAKIVIYLLAIVGLMVHIIGTYKLSMAEGAINSLFKGYYNIPCVLYSLGVFLFLRDLGSLLEKVNWIRLFFAFLGKYTFPLYLIHWFVLRLIDDHIKISKTSIGYRLFAPYAIFLIVIGVTWILRRIPIIRKIVP